MRLYLSQYKILYATIVVSFLFLNNVFSQQKLPEIVLPSPQSKAFQAYGEYPVNYNTGIPDISIPLYTIKSGELDVPITLRYYSSGIKPYETDQSNIGSGWTLDVGGLVSRTVQGRADELYKKPTPFLTALQINQEDYNHVLYLDEIITSRTKDALYDNFSYSFAGSNGHFAIEDNGSGSFTAYSYPFVPYQINVKTSAPTDPKYYKSISGIDIITDKGFKYQFGYSNIEKAIVDADAAPTGWYLEQISNASGADNVTFSYEAIPSYQWISTEGAINIVSNGSPGDNGVKIGIPCGDGNEPMNSSFSGYCDVQGSGITYETKNIKTITFKQGSVDFNLSTSKKLIESIVVRDVTGKVIRTIIFDRDNFPNSSYNRLKSVTISGTSSSPQEQYVFSYNELYPVADNRCLIDQWGFCRGEAANTRLCKRRDVKIINNQSPGTEQTITVGDDNMIPNESYMKRFILEKIKYPTGGTTEFTYTANQFINSSGVNEIGGGLRISKIISKDGNNGVVTKSFEYDPGFLEHPLSNVANYITSRFVISQQCLAADLSTPVYYIFRNLSLDNGWNKILGSNNVYYNKITEYTGSDVNNMGKVVYTYTYDNADQVSPTSIGNGVRGQFIPNYYISQQRNWGNGLLKTKEIYKNAGVNGYQKVYDIVNDYNFVDIKTLTGLYAYQVASYNGYVNSALGTYTARNNISSSGIYSKSNLLQGTSLNSKQIITGAYYLKSTIETKYDGANSIGVKTDYEYGNPSHYYPTKIIKDLSSNERKVTEMAYVNEFSSAAPYSLMKSLNILQPVIQTTEYIRNSLNVDRLISSQKVNFANWGSNIFKPITIESKVQANSFDVKVRFNAYNLSGNILEQQKENDVKVIYFWGYNSEYPVAKVINSEYNTAKGFVTQSLLDNVNNAYTDAQMRTELNKLRANLPEAQVTTYTYAPLVGMTSETDPNGKTIYYEYDGLNRLKLIRDKDNNIIKRFDYQYQQQP